uniref:Uncharacterized protein LOC111102362 isoform X2 n=1 Tax=Crassostrea virginica TaxID=6565 RepID=A0A8B8AH95_CRAVI|nr:uncharacterized protein LOC111102362 isoform X2 [Crassostrea virginica]
MASKDEENFLKLVLLLLKYGGRVLQDRIECELERQKQQTVSDFLEEYKHKILHLTLRYKKECCQKDCRSKNRAALNEQYLKCMFHIMEKKCCSSYMQECFCNLEPRADLDISFWDITLTSCLLLECDILTDQSQKQVIKNLRNHRNSRALLHRGTPSMGEEEFVKTWKEVSNAIKEVAEVFEPWYFKHYCDKIDKLKDGTLSTSDIEGCWKKIKDADFDKELYGNLPAHKDFTTSTEMENLAYYHSLRSTSLNRQIMMHGKGGTNVNSALEIDR